MNDVWHSAVVKSECVSSRILWIKFKFSRVKVCVIKHCRKHWCRTYVCAIAPKVIRRMGVPNACIRELCEMIKWENERIDESVLWWFSQVEGIENDRIAKMVGICKSVCW